MNTKTKLLYVGFRALNTCCLCAAFLMITSCGDNVVNPDSPELGVKSRQPDIEIVGVLVPNDDRKRSSEDAVADEIGFILHPGLFVHAQETLVLFACQANVIARVAEGFAARNGGRFIGSIHRASVF